MNKEDFIKLCKPGDLIFFRDNSFVSRAIRAFSGKWSHVETVCHKINLKGYKDALIVSARELDGGTVAPWLLSNALIREGLRVLLMRPRGTNNQKKLQIEYLYKTIGRKYDYKNLFGRLKKRLMFWKTNYKIADDPLKDICSENARDALYSGRIIRHKEKTTNPNPSQLAKYPELITIKETSFKKN